MQLLCKIIKDGTKIDEENEILHIKRGFAFQVEETLNEVKQKQMEVAKIEAEKILGEAQQKAKLIETEAYQRGLQQGLGEAKDIIEKAKSNAWEMITELENYRQETLENLKEEIRELAFQIAEKVILMEISLGQDVTKSLVFEVVKGVKNRKKIHIFVNPRDIACLEENRIGLQRVLDEATLEFFSDSSIEMGGCRIHTEKGWVDATIDNQLKELRTIFMSQ